MILPYINEPKFVWSETKNLANSIKHHISFSRATGAFFDQKRVVVADKKHSNKQERRYYCIGKINNDICTVRFTVRNNYIRIIGAGYWRKERKIYEKVNKN